MLNRTYSALLTLHTVLMLASLCLVHQYIVLFGIQFSISSLIFPVTFLITDLTAELYGYHESKEIMWTGLLAQIPFSILCILAAFLPQTETMSTDYYAILFHDLWRVSLASLIGAYLGLSCNIHIFSKLQRYSQQLPFFLRYIIASLCGEIVFTLIAIPIMFYGNMSFALLLSCLIASGFLKLAFNFLMAFPSQWLVTYLGKQQVLGYDSNTYHFFSYNPFNIDNK